MTNDKSDRILIGTWPHKIWATEKMQCNDCKECWADPGSLQCIYGGPHIWVNEYYSHTLNIEFFEIKCSVCDLSYKDDKYKRDIDRGFPLYFYKGVDSYTQFCSCECGLKWHKENVNV